MTPPPTKICASCGRTITWRKKWERDWDSVRYCSRRCRGAGVGPIDLALEAAILDLLDARPAGATICPSEAVRRVSSESGTDGGPDGWRSLMEPGRRAARRLVDRGVVDITQAGRVVDASTATGPIRIRRR